MEESPVKSETKILADSDLSSGTETTSLVENLTEMRTHSLAGRKTLGERSS